MSLPLQDLNKRAPVQVSVDEHTACCICRANTFVYPLNKSDFALLGTLTVLLYPVFKIAHLPLRINFIHISVVFWFGTAVTGTFAAVLFSLIALPLSCTIIPFARRLNQKKGLALIALVLAVTMFSLFGPWLGFIVTVDALTAGELLERTKGPLKEKLADVVVPVAYLFFGVILLLAFNHAVPGIRNPGSYDKFLKHADWVLFRVNVPTLVHDCLNRFPLWYFRAFELIYYGMFIHITGTLILLATARGRRYAVQMVRTIVICNTIGLIVYAAMPAIGPWANCPLHQITYPHSLPTFLTQEMILSNANLLWTHTPTPEAGRVDVTDAFISFPSLHVAGPLIAFWFMRGFRWMARAYFAGYLFCLMPSVVLLEWHYLVDLLAGFAIALFAIWVGRLFSDPMFAINRGLEVTPVGAEAELG